MSKSRNMFGDGGGLLFPLSLAVDLEDCFEMTTKSLAATSMSLDLRLLLFSLR